MTTLSFPNRGILPITTSLLWFLFYTEGIPDSGDETETVTTGEFSVSCGCSAMTSSPSVNTDAVEEREGSDNNRGSPSAPIPFLTTFGVVLTAVVAFLTEM